MTDLDANLPDLADDLAAAAESLEADRIEVACDKLLVYLRRQPSPPKPKIAKRLLDELRKWRHFGAIQRIADALIRLGCDAHVIYRYYAQALVDRGELIAALELLRPLAERARGDAAEYAEVCGLLGRVYKQIYIEAQGSRLGMGETALAEAIAWYRSIYETRPDQFWHGINVVALLRRAERDGIPVPNASDARAIATAIVHGLNERWEDEGLTAWDFATAAEACVALEDWRGAERWLQKYLRAQDVNMFGIASTLRQLTEVWGLRVDGSPGGELIPVLRTAMLYPYFLRKNRSHEHGRLDLTPAQVQHMHHATADAFERILGGDGFKTYKWMCQGIERARAVAKVCQPDGRGVGTGFLVRGSDLYPPLDGEHVLLTNAHIVSNDPAHRAAVTSEDAEITFDALKTPEKSAPSRRVRELVWTSAPEALDASVLRLDAPVDGLEPCPIAKNLPTRGEGQRVYVIGHPLGGELSLSLQDNRLLDHEGQPRGCPSRAGRCLLHYYAPTEHGSSGSPVFEQSNWKVIGLHHAGCQSMPKLNGKASTYAANEGIWIQSIAAMLQRTSRPQDMR